MRQVLVGPPRRRLADLATAPETSIPCPETRLRASLPIAPIRPTTDCQTEAGADPDACPPCHLAATSEETTAITRPVPGI